MYNSSSSSHHSSAAPNSTNNPSTMNLMRYDSAPSSFLSNAVSSLPSTLPHHHHHQQQQNQCYSSAGDQSLSLNAPETTTTATQSSKLHGSGGHHDSKSTLTLLSSYGFNNNDGASNNHHNNGQPSSSNTSNLIRHSSSPAGFLHHLTSDINGYAVSKGMENYESHSGHKLSRLSSQLSFTKQDHHALSQISEVNECMIAGISSQQDDHKRSAASHSRPTSGFSLSTWDDSNNGYVFSAPSSSKRGKHSSDEDFLNGLAAMDSQYGITQSSLEMAAMDRTMLHIPPDSVPCKIRAKRGFATHPRSIAERERRTRISGKLKKLQELVPNMDKQTSYSDMLDLAVQHINGLQSQIQKLNKDLKNCSCGCKQSTQR